ncbi:hypothetical protein ACHAXR_000866, partial [Thalassiosira sp. AJA248-18]
ACGQNTLQQCDFHPRGKIHDNGHFPLLPHHPTQMTRIHPHEDVRHSPRNPRRIQITRNSLIGWIHLYHGHSWNVWPTASMTIK